MCGIVGYIGGRDAAPVLIDSLRKLEYRGYDSAGIAVLNGGGIELRRAEGKLARLETLLAGAPIEGHAGIGHTRWATHGGPTEANAHPHRAGDTDDDGSLHDPDGVMDFVHDLREEHRADLVHLVMAEPPNADDLEREIGAPVGRGVFGVDQKRVGHGRVFPGPAVPAQWLTKATVSPPSAWGK